MNHDFYNVIGVMSGTSLDGVDLAHIHFTSKNNKWHFKILENETVSYTNYWINKLKQAVDFSESELDLLNKDYTKEKLEESLGKVNGAYAVVAYSQETDKAVSYTHLTLPTTSRV